MEPESVLDLGVGGEEMLYLGMLIAGFLTDYLGGAKTIASFLLVLIPAIILMFGIKNK